MSVDRSEVERIAGLAHLKLSQAEVDQMSQEMTRILEYAGALRAHTRAEGTGPSSDDAGPPSAVFHLTEPVLSSDWDIDPSRTDEAGYTSSTALMAEGFFVVPRPPGMTDPDPSE
jgi:hypothetical protein